MPLAIVMNTAFHKMFSLVKYDNDEYAIVQSKNVKSVQGKSCYVKYKGASYSGYLVDTHDSREDLEVKIDEHSGKERNGSLEDLEGKNDVDSIKERNVSREDTIGVKDYTLPSFNISQDISCLEGITCSTPTKNEVHVSNTELTIESSAPSGATDLLAKVDAIFGENFLRSDNELCNEIEVPADGDTIIVEKSSEVNPCIVHDEQLEQTLPAIIDSNIEAITSNGENITDGKKKSDNTVTADDKVIEENVSEYLPSADATATSANVSSSLPKKYSRNSSIRNRGKRIDSQTLRVIPSNKFNEERTTKKHFCKYCHKLRSKIGDHIITVHKNIDEVKKVLTYKPKDPRRLKLLSEIRNQGDFIHNTHLEHNTGTIITCRRPQKKFGSTPEDFLVCSTCLGFYSKKTLRIHHIKCNPMHRKGEKGQTSEGRDLKDDIHHKATPEMKELYKSFNGDAVSRFIKHDLLLILYGNKLCDIYTEDHLDDMKRNYLRLLSRYTITMRELNNNITDFASTFHPQFYDDCVKAVKIVAKYDSRKKMFRVPYNATTLGIHLKKCSKTLKAHCTRENEQQRNLDRKGFMSLFLEDYPTVSKRSVSDMHKARREKQENQSLPSKEDISTLYKYLKQNCEQAMKILVKKFQAEAWRNLNESCLTLLQIFNRRRAGEIERFLVVNYNKQETVEKSLNADMYCNLSELAKKHASEFVRVVIRGKLDRTVPVLIHKYLVTYINTLLKYRKRAGVADDNKYLFAVPNSNTNKKNYLRACPLMRKFADKCKATLPNTLRGTTLRKHIATHTAMLGIEDTQVSDLANFMGHADAMHKHIYRVPIGLKEMAEVSRLLVAAMGDSESESEAEDDGKPERNERKTKGTKRRVNTNTHYLDDEPTHENEPRPSTSGYQNSSAVHQLHDDGTDPDRVTVSPRVTPSSEDEYQPRTITSRKRRFPISESEDDCHSSPRFKIKRIRWTAKEKTVVKNVFGDLKSLTKMPGIPECDEIVAEHEELQARTGRQLRAFIDNELKADTRKKAYHMSKSHSKK